MFWKENLEETTSVINKRRDFSGLLVIEQISEAKLTIQKKNFSFAQLGRASQ
jgi:hypothetical protein